MKMEGRGWDEELVNDMFNAQDRNLILSIQLSDTPCDDCWYWSKESSGGYSVRSAYKMLQQHNGSWPTAGADKKWQQLWLLDILAKAKHMLWRALSGCLPTKVQLDTKHVNVDLTCPLCHVDIETISHVLMHCDFAKSCWNISAIDFQRGGGTPDFAIWFGEALLKDTLTVMEERAMVTWRIWLARNDILWNNKTTTAFEVVRSARTNLDSWKNAQVQRTAPLLNVNYSNGREHWMKPMTHKFKINVDGAIFEAENCFGIGCVIRDQTARLVEAISVSKHGGVTPEIAEAIGVKEALSWIKKKALSDVEIETDSLVVVQAINGGVTMTSQFGMLIHDCRMMVSSLNNVLISHVKRSANRAAHWVARQSYFMLDCIFNELNAPSDLISIVMDDCLS
uniref:RNase H type-1 domain-containing protein n=1 Tax=Cannabis sativa TaxID=3483 RepID=A0A803QMW8_CANSA